MQLPLQRKWSCKKCLVFCNLVHGVHECSTIYCEDVNLCLEYIKIRRLLPGLLAEVGFSFLLNVSGKLYTNTKASLKDVGGNARVLQHLQPQCFLLWFYLSCMCVWGGNMFETNSQGYLPGDESVQRQRPILGKDLTTCDLDFLQGQLSLA